MKRPLIRPKFLLLLMMVLPLSAARLETQPRQVGARPNILFCTSDDQSAAHAGAAGDPVVRTPAFDRIAGRGVLFTHAFADAPSCTPSRSAILTGQHIWRLEEGGNLHSTLPARFDVFPELLQASGYAIGHHGKAWGPGIVEAGGRTENPAGPRFRNFQTFLEQVPEGKPFYFWLGSPHPHRPYPEGSGAESGLKAEDVPVPPQFPDTPVVRNDILDYYLAIEKFDRMVMEALDTLEAAGLLENTLIVVTSDHGMPFPRGKASLYDLGTRVPLAMSWPARLPENRRVDDLVLLSDLAPTLLEAAGQEPPSSMTGHSLLPLAVEGGSGRQTSPRDAVFYGMERHSGARRGGKGYPTRAIRTEEFLYIRNFEPDRWPAGEPDAESSARAIPYGDVDPSPTKTLLMDHRNLYPDYFERAFAKRPAEELYDLKKDPAQLENVASEAQYEKVKDDLAGRLMAYLKETQDPRALGQPALWDYYPFYGRLANPSWSVDEPPFEQ